MLKNQKLLGGFNSAHSNFKYITHTKMCFVLLKSNIVLLEKTIKAYGFSYGVRFQISIIHG